MTCFKKWTITKRARYNKPVDNLETTCYNKPISACIRMTCDLTDNRFIASCQQTGCMLAVN